MQVVGRIMLHCISAREGTQGDQRVTMLMQTCRWLAALCCTASLRERAHKVISMGLDPGAFFQTGEVGFNGAQKEAVHTK
eukprot:1146625-Pelagomonas_calceolata.AAC.2